MCLTLFWHVFTNLPDDMNSYTQAYVFVYPVCVISQTISFCS